MRKHFLGALTWAARVALGAIFIFASWHKLELPADFALDIFHYQLLPGIFINALALLLPWLELFSGIALVIAPRLRQGAAILVLGMLVVFTTGIAIDLFRGIDVSCGCFSAGGNGRHIGTMKVLENLAMIAGACFLVWRERESVPVPRLDL